MPGFVGFDQDRFALFRWSGSSFEAIPFQVDEIQSVVQLIPPIAHCTADLPVGAKVCESNYAFLDNADPGTDGMAGFDGNDELVFMARDASTEAPGGSSYPPSGTWFNQRYDIKVQDEKLVGNSVVPQSASWVYLFYSSVPIEPLYGDKHYVTWTTVSGRAAAFFPESIQVGRILGTTARTSDRLSRRVHAETASSSSAARCDGVGRYSETTRDQQHDSG